MENEKENIITYQEYRNAVEVVSNYEKQQRDILAVHHPILGLEKNDYVIYIGGSTSQYLKKGRKYRMTCKPLSNKRYRRKLSIINDAGRKMIVRHSMFIPTKNK